MYTQKQKPNSWLVDKTFIDQIEFDNKAFLLLLLEFLKSFINKCPVPLLTYWDHKLKRIYVSIGKENIFHITVDPTISYHDHLYLLEQKIKGFYPQYNVHIEKESTYTAEEITEILKIEKNLNPDDLFNRKKIIREKEFGIIDRCWILQDNFRIYVYNKGSIRISTIPLSEFLKTLRKMSDDSEKKAFIFNHSNFVTEISNKKVVIDYPDNWLLNFFKIHKQELQKEELVPIDDTTYFCGPYCVSIKNHIYSQISEILKY